MLMENRVVQQQRARLDRTNLTTKHIDKKMNKLQSLSKPKVGIHSLYILVWYAMKTKGSTDMSFYIFNYV